MNDDLGLAPYIIGAVDPRPTDDIDLQREIRLAKRFGQRRDCVQRQRCRPRSVQFSIAIGTYIAVDYERVRHRNIWTT